MVVGRLAVLPLALPLLALPLRAQRAGVVLALPASARAAGVGDAAPFATGASALFYGAHNLPGERTASMSVGSWLGGAQFATAAAAFRVGRRLAAGVGVQSLDYGSAEEIVPDPLTGGTRGTATGARVGASELALTAGLAGRSRRSRLGVSVAYVRQQVADLSASTLALSQGVGVTARGWDVELTQEHAGKAMDLGATSSGLVMTHRAALQTPVRTLGGWHWVSVAEWRTVRGEGQTALLGAEGSVTTNAGWRLAVRGAAASLSAETIRDPWSVGGSAARGGWSLDYAYQGFGPLGVVHRMGVAWRSRVVRSPSR